MCRVIPVGYQGVTLSSLPAPAPLCSGYFAAVAQQAANPEAVTTPEVIVTGSRIKQPNLTSTSPIQVVSDREIELNGTTDMIGLLNTLPQLFMNNAADVSGTSQVLAGAGGISTADLRGLGPQRTLVLIDGKRLGTGDANTFNGSPAPEISLEAPGPRPRSMTDTTSMKPAARRAFRW